jgi:hypothetical protein
MQTVWTETDEFFDDFYGKSIVDPGGKYEALVLMPD